MFGHKSAPSRIYNYGILPPVDGAEIVDRQMRQAHRYKNALVHHELIRRRKVERTLRKLSPELIEIDAKIAACDQMLLGAEKLLKDAHVETRKRSLPKHLTEAVKEARANRRDSYQQRKTLRKELFASSAWKAEQEEVESWTLQAAHRLRRACGLYWGTYLHVEQSMADRRAGAPPEFSRWNGNGHLAIQIQKGMLPADAFACQDTRLRIEPVPPEAWEKGAPRRLLRTRIHFRVGSADKGKPVWAIFPMILHRPMPKDALIKWVHLTRRRIATHFKWDVQIVLSRDLGWEKPDRAESGAVGIDVGWRMRPDGSLRTAYWVDDEGREGEVLLPARWVQGVNYPAL